MQVSVIIGRCHDDMRQALQIVDPVADTGSVVELFRCESATEMKRELAVLRFDVAEGGYYLL